MSMTRYTKFNPDGSGRFEKRTGPSQELKPTRSQSAVEWTLFVVFGLLLILAGFAIYSQYDPKHKIVPNTVDRAWKEDRINLLIIGVGGASHPGGGKDLADAILLASFKPSTHQVAIISIPRDFWVKVPGHGQHRINQAHAIGNQSGYPGEGPGLLCDTVESIFAQPIHGFVRIDFSAFEKIIDDVGGVDVYCQRSFYDYLFHDGFKQGWHHLDGKRALRYARYRYVLGPEGDNFARELRQQQVVNALRDKLQRRGPQDAMRLIQAGSTLSGATETNLSTSQLIAFYRAFHDVKPGNVRSVSLKPFTRIFDVTRFADPGQAVITRTGNYNELQDVARTVFNDRRPIATEDQIHLAVTPPLPPQPQSTLLAAQ
ncbi:MAG TPA: LCP family protein [Thermoanaerobaculia bacterium]|nr:LCP family protein [Thermoanaerobaculia bacterium]